MCHKFEFNISFTIRSVCTTLTIVTEIISRQSDHHQRLCIFLLYFFTCMLLALNFFTHYSQSVANVLTSKYLNAVHKLMILLCNFISVLGKMVANIERSVTRKCVMKREGMTYIILRKICNLFCLFCC